MYILSLDDITIEVALRSWRGVKSFNYVFYINEIDEFSGDPNAKSSSYIEIKMDHSPLLEGYHKHEILFENYTEDEYEEMLSNMLHTYFDPYKEDSLQYLRDNSCNMCLRKEAREFLGLN